MSWLYEDVLEGSALPPDILALMQYHVRDETGALEPVINESLKTHLDRLQFYRQHFLSKFSGMSSEEFRRPRKVEDYTVTPEWVIHHLIQHEAEHRGQIGEIQISPTKRWQENKYGSSRKALPLSSCCRSHPNKNYPDSPTQPSG